MRGRIFISYRRDDSASQALNIAQYLEKQFGASNVFIDVNRIKSGEAFPEVLKKRLDESAVVLAIIGPNWLNASDAQGNRRLDDAQDWVRLEIASALRRKMKVIPVLVGGQSAPPKATDLPEPLQALSAQHAAVITTNGFRYEMAGLAGDVRAIVGRDWRTPLLAAGGAAMIVLIAWLAVLAGVGPGGRTVTTATTSFEDLLTQGCRTQLADWRKSRAFAAFAFATNGSCGSSRDKEKVAEARDAALDACKKSASDCRIAELIEGDWTMRPECEAFYAEWKSKPPIKSFALAKSGHCYAIDNSNMADTARLEALSGCERVYGTCRTHDLQQGNWEMVDECKKALPEWRKKPATRVFAVARSGSCGESYNHVNLDEATKVALDECAKTGSECKVTESQEGNWEIEGECKDLAQKWTRLRGRGSFAVGKSGGCGYSHEYNSAGQADTEALSQCRQNQGYECKIVGRR